MKIGYSQKVINTRQSLYFPFRFYVLLGFVYCLCLNPLTNRLLYLYAGPGHVEQILAQLQLPEPVPLDAVVVRVTGVCVRFLVRTVSRGHRSHLVQHAAYLGPGETRRCLQSGEGFL